MPETIPPTLVDAVIAIARRAGAAILTVYDAGPSVHSTKADQSPLTEADLRSHAIIEASLTALTPGLPVLSEESSGIDPAERARWHRFWLVDPLDGTKEFLSRNGEFTVNIALIDGHAPVLGVVYAPARDELYVGTIAQGAFRERGGAGLQRIVASGRSGPVVRVVGSRSHRGDSLDGLLERLGPHTLLAVGSSLKFCLIAEGAADLYPRLGPTSEWDTAAAHAVLVAAGGSVVTTDGAPLQYNRKAELLNPPFLAYADAGRDWLSLL